MKIIRTAIPDVIIIEPQVFGDVRGYFLEVWNKSRYEEAGITCEFVQDNESKSRYGVIRGLHYQTAPYGQAKLVRVFSGAVLDVAVDIRKGSPTFGQSVSSVLSGDNKRQMFIPRGFAHGFAVLSQEAIFTYKCDNLYMPAAERGIRFDDPQLNIDWSIPECDWVLSERDKKHPSFAEAEYQPYN